MKKVLVVGLALVLTLICCGKVLAAPTIDFEGSEIRISGEYLPERWWGGSPLFDAWEWGIGGTIKLNIRQQFVVYFASIEAELLSFTAMGKNCLKWYPLMQDYYWRATVGIEISRMTLEVYFNQYCLHAIDDFKGWTINDYTGLGFLLAVGL